MYNMLLKTFTFEYLEVHDVAGLVTLRVKFVNREIIGLILELVLICNGYSILTIPIAGHCRTL